MGEWKTQLSIRVSQDFRRAFEAFAEKERRKTSAMADIVLTWAFEQLKAAGSIERLLKYQLGNRGNKTRAPQAGGDSQLNRTSQNQQALNRRPGCRLFVQRPQG
jgi:hypothetical protein